MTTAPASSITSIDELARRIADANRTRTALRVLGAGTWRHAGRPVTASSELSLAMVRGIVDYTPGDFTLTARAGTTLAELDELTRPHGQWVALDPPGSRSGTLGATFATASAGPLAVSHGAPRDVALGVTFVTGEGKVVHGGGRVVKNVAGFDLVRLAIGSWGTLGALAEMTVRVRALPDVDATFRMPLPDAVASLAERLAAVRESAAQPIAIQLVNAALARRLGIEPSTAALIRLAGNRASVASQRDALNAIAPLEEVPGSVWTTLSESEPGDARVVRLAGPPTGLPFIWNDVAARFGTTAALLQARVWHGAIRIASSTDQDAAMAEFLGRPPECATLVPERLPPALWASLAKPRHPADAIASRIRQAFDPNRILNPGILGDQ